MNDGPIAVPTARRFHTKALSTNADGVTGSEIMDVGGLALAGIKLSTGAGPCLIGFRGSVELSSNIAPLVNVFGDRITLGTTDESLGGKMMVIDPPMFAGIRKLQIQCLGSTGGGIAQNTGVTAEICVTNRS